MGQDWRWLPSPHYGSVSGLLLTAKETEKSISVLLSETKERDRPQGGPVAPTTWTPTPELPLLLSLTPAPVSRWRPALEGVLRRRKTSVSITALLSYFIPVSQTALQPFKVLSFPTRQQKPCSSPRAGLYFKYFFPFLCLPPTQTPPPRDPVGRYSKGPLAGWVIILLALLLSCSVKEPLSKS